jgi:hypothetical protein
LFDCSLSFESFFTLFSYINKLDVFCNVSFSCSVFKDLFAQLSPSVLDDNSTIPEVSQLNFFILF